MDNSKTTPVKIKIDRQIKYIRNQPTAQLLKHFREPVRLKGTTNRNCLPLKIFFFNGNCIIRAVKQAFFFLIVSSFTKEALQCLWCGKQQGGDADGAGLDSAYVSHYS